MREPIESLWHACAEGDLDRVRALIEAGQHDVDGGNRWQVDIDPRGWQRSPLVAAVTGGHLSVARWLLAQGADVNLPTKYGDTPLNLVLQPPLMANWDEAVRLLVEYGADPSVSNDEGRSAIDYASATPGVWTVVGPLLERTGGADT